MNAAAAPETVIVGAEISAGHDGAAELTILLRYENGVTAPVIVDARVGFSLMRNCGATCLDDLKGQSWRHFLEGMDDV
jgi:hypothetical protein